LSRDALQRAVAEAAGYGATDTRFHCGEPSALEVKGLTLPLQVEAGRQSFKILASAGRITPSSRSAVGCARLLHRSGSKNRGYFWKKPSLPGWSRVAMTSG